MTSRPAGKFSDVTPCVLSASTNCVLAWLDAEIARVRGENQVIFHRTIDEWHALPPLTSAGNPPIFQGSGYASIRVLGLD
jgi:hypothetical protein